MLLQHPFGLLLGDEQQEGVGRVVNAYVTKLEVRCRASSYEGRDLERAPPERHELVGDAHLLQKLERTGVDHESAAPPRAHWRLVDDPASDAPCRELGRHLQPRRTGPDYQYIHLALRWLAHGRLLASWLESFKKDTRRRFQVLFIREAVFQQCREEQLSCELRHEHSYKGPGARTGVVRLQPSEIDLVLQIILEKLQYPTRAASDEHLGDLRAANGFSDHELQHPGVELLEGEVGSTEPRQYCLGGEIHYRSKIRHRTQEGHLRTQNLTKESLLVREVPVDQGRRLQPRSPRNALDRRPFKALGGELLERSLQDLLPTVRFLSALLVQGSSLIDRSINNIHGPKRAVKSVFGRGSYTRWGGVYVRWPGSARTPGGVSYRAW